MIRSRKYFIITAVIVAAVLAFAAMLPSVRLRMRFYTLGFARGEGAVRARASAALLRETELGVVLAARDADALGGKTLGYSSWILKTSPLQDVVVSCLEPVAEDDRESLARRIEASRLLWERTHRKEWLLKLFDLCRGEGHPCVTSGRNALYTALSHTEFGKTFQKNWDTPLDLDESAVKLAIERLDVGMHPVNSSD